MVEARRRRAHRQAGTGAPTWVRARLRRSSFARLPLAGICGPHGAGRSQAACATWMGRRKWTSAMAWQKVHAHAVTHGAVAATHLLCLRTGVRCAAPLHDSRGGGRSMEVTVVVVVAVVVVVPIMPPSSGGPCQCQQAADEARRREGTRSMCHCRRCLTTKAVCSTCQWVPKGLYRLARLLQSRYLFWRACTWTTASSALHAVCTYMGPEHGKHSCGHVSRADASRVLLAPRRGGRRLVHTATNLPRVGLLVRTHRQGRATETEVRPLHFTRRPLT